jgi:glycogen debranching enzyme
MLAASGLARYGHHVEAGTLIRAVLDAAGQFEDDRLPELFCGLQRTHEPPVPYAEANSPQAWAAAVPILATQTLLGLVPDAPHHRCFLTPWLPEWLTHIEVQGIRIGDATVDVSVSRNAGSVSVETTTNTDLEVILDAVAAPLWGRPGSPSGDRLS